MSCRRQEMLVRFHAMRTQGVPIVGGGAGTGLSAKAAEAGGIDLLVIYNSGKFRMAGRGSLAGMMPYGNANEIVVELGHGAGTKDDRADPRGAYRGEAYACSGRCVWHRSVSIA